MRQITLRLPDSLHKSLQAQAQEEGISLNQFIVYQLTRASTASDIAQQQQTIAEFLNRHPPEESEAALQRVLEARAPASS